MADVARRAEVSVMTVSRVLNGYPGVSVATRRRVEKAMTALDAGDRLEAACRVIEPAVDHLAVARGCLETDRVGLFEDDDLFPGERQRARHGKSDHPGSDNHRLDFVHRLAPLLGSAGRMLAASVCAPQARLRCSGGRAVAFRIHQRGDAPHLGPMQDIVEPG